MEGWGGGEGASGVLPLQKKKEGGGGLAMLNGVV